MAYVELLSSPLGRLYNPATWAHPFLKSHPLKRFWALLGLAVRCVTPGPRLDRYFSTRRTQLDSPFVHNQPAVGRGVASAGVFFARRVAEPRPMRRLFLASEAPLTAPAPDSEVEVIVVRIATGRLMKNPGGAHQRRG